MPRLRLRTVAVLVVANLMAGFGVWQVAAQEPPVTLLPPPTTDTTAPPPTDTPPASEPDPETTEPDTTTDPNADLGGDGGDGSGGARVVPSEARRFIDSIRRTAPNDNEALVRAAQNLVANGMPEADTIRYAYGRFPVAGYARWSDDWAYPRWTGNTFRYHLGCDVLAAYGTPMRAVVDGVVRISNSALGGLGLRLYEPDGTFYYYAHLSALPQGLTEGQSVATGDVIGFVGDSGNARGGPPHLHFEVHPRGGEAVPPKPYLDQWVLDAEALIPDLLAVAQESQPRGLLATRALRRLTADTTVERLSATPSRTELLFASSASPLGGALFVAEAAADSVARTVDWDARAIEQQAFVLAWDQAADRARWVLDPLVPDELREAAAVRAANARST